MISDLVEFVRIRRLHAQSSVRVKVHQVLGLRDVVQAVFAETPFYADRMRAAGNRPGDLRTVKDLLGFPATTATALAEHLAGIAGGGAGAERAGAGGGAGTRAISLDASGRVLAVPAGLDARSRRLHLFAALGAWGSGPRARVVFASAEDFGQGASAGWLFGVRREAALGDARRGGGPRVVDPGQAHAALSGLAGGASASRIAGRVVLRGATLPPAVLASLGLTGAAAPRAILGNALFGPIAWQCVAGAMHPIAPRAVIEAVTEESVARGLTGGSRASRAPRTAGELHLTLIERSEFPIFRVALGLRGRFVEGCPCGARTDRIEMEIPFLGPLAIAGGAFADPLPILHAAAAVPGVRRVALLQESEDRARLLVAVAARTDDAAGTTRVVQSFHWDAESGGAPLAAQPTAGAGAPQTAAAVPAAPATPARADFASAVRAALATLSPAAPITIEPEVGNEADLPFPDRGFIRGLDQPPLLHIGDPP